MMPWASAVRLSSFLGKTSSLCNAFWSALYHLWGHRSFNFLLHTYITQWMEFTTSLLSSETPELAKTNYQGEKKKKRAQTEILHISWSLTTLTGVSLKDWYTFLNVLLSYDQAVTLSTGNWLDLFHKLETSPNCATIVVKNVCSLS